MDHVMQTIVQPRNGYKVLREVFGIQTHWTTRFMSKYWDQNMMLSQSLFFHHFDATR